MQIIDNYDGFIFDLDGTIYIDDKIIPNADKVISQIKKKNKKIIFISNKTTGTVHEYFELLRTNKVDVEIDEIVNATIVTKQYLEEHHHGKSFFAIGENSFINEIEESNLIFEKEPSKIDIVLITLDRTLDYTKLEIAAKALDNGAKFYAANIDNTCPVANGEILDAGSTISALEKRTNKKLEKHFGKPSKFMIDVIKNKLNIPFERCLIIGDRIETDIAMGNKFGIDSALVNTGVIKKISTNKIHPTYELNSVNDLLNTI